MADECGHDESVYWPIGESFKDGFSHACPCGIRGTGPTAQLAHTSFLKARMEKGERMTSGEEATVAFTPSPWGTRPSCHHP